MEIGIILGTYALSIALVESDGPYNMLSYIRNLNVVNNFGLLNCITCTSLWVAIALCMAFNRPDLILISWGSTVLIERLLSAYIVK